MTTTPLRPRPEIAPAEAVNRLHRWFTGSYGEAHDAAMEVVAEPGADLPALAASGLLDTEALLFAEPGAAAGFPVPSVSLDGSVLNCGDELTVMDELFIQVYDYISLGFIAVVGPTVLRITGEDDLAAFLAEADQAASGGGLPSWLVHPSVTLADVPALSGAAQAGLARLYVTADGMVRTAPGGADLARLADGAAAVRTALAAHAADPSLNGVLPPGLLGRAHAERPWLARYLRALDAARSLQRVVPAPIQISGFGMRLCPQVPNEPLESADDPMIALAGDGTCYLLCQGRRVFKLGTDAAKLVEAKLACTDPRQADEVAASALGVRVDDLPGLYSRLPLPEVSAA
jgi:hypothetical protein